MQDTDLAAADDPVILAWAANEQRVVLTHDVNTMTRYALERIRSGELTAGLFLVHQERTAPLAIIDDLLLLDECSETAEWASQILYLPLG